MERVDIGAVFEIGSLEALDLAKETVNLMVTLSASERSTLFLFLVKKPDLYLSSREVTEKLKTANIYKPNIQFLTVLQEKDWLETLSDWFRDTKVKYFYIWGGEKTSFDTIDNLYSMYVEYPMAGLIEGRSGDYMIKPNHLFEEYSENLKEDLEKLGYKNYKLEIDEEE